MVISMVRGAMGRSGVPRKTAKGSNENGEYGCDLECVMCQRVPFVTLAYLEVAHAKICCLFLSRYSCHSPLVPVVATFK